MTNQKNKKRMTIITAVFAVAVLNLGFGFGFAEKANAGVIFEDNFDDHSDWSPEQSLVSDYGVATGALDGSTACTAESEHIACPDGSSKYSAYYQARSAWADWKGNNTLNIGSDNARGGSGKALTLWMEPMDSIRCDGGTKWCSDGELSVNLPQSYPEIYMRYYIKFQPGWVWADSGGSGKFLRASHYHNYPGVAYYKFFKEGNHFPIFVMDLSDQAYFTTDGSDPFAEVHMHPRFQSAYYGSASVPQPDYLVNWDYERIRVGTGGTGWNGYITFEQFLANGDWHDIEVHLKGNSAMGAEDGVWELWVDGESIVSRNNIAWADSVYEEACANCVNPPSDFVGWNWISIGGNEYNIAYPADQHVEQWYAIDDFVVSTNYIGPGYVIGTPATDTTPPLVTVFTLPQTSTSSTVPITEFTATDAVGVTGYKLTETSDTPTAEESGWESFPQTSYTFLTGGIKTLCAWAKDAQGNISSSRSGSVTISLSIYTLTNFISAITNWLQIGNETSDVNSDGVVNTRDLGVMMSGWGE